MSIPVLVEVYQEMRRLAIAGSAVAPGDFRLKKLIAPLQKSAEKSPVFGKVAQAVQAVVESDDKTASAALLELTTLVNAILYTQGETGVAGDLKPLETTDLGARTPQAGARTLKPLLEALRSTGSGRMELVRDAFELGTFNDLRLVKPSLAALDDPYSEIAEFIADSVLPLYGVAILPELRARLDIKGRGGHLHRLQLMHRLDPGSSRDMIQLALNEGSREMKVAAIECLGKHDQDVAYLLEQSRSKAKEVRAAALRSLAASNIGTTDVLVALKKAIAGDDLELIVESARESLLPEVQEIVLQQAEQQFAEVLKLTDKNAQGRAIARLRQLLACLEERTDARAEAFLLRCFESGKVFASIKSEPSGGDLNEWVASILAHAAPRLQKRLAADHKTLSGEMLSSAIWAARAIMTPADFYEEFGPLLRARSQKRTKKNSAELDRAEVLLRTLLSGGDRGANRWRGAVRGAGRRKPPALKELDPRWLDAAIDAQSFELVSQLARPGHAPTQQFLSDQLAVRTVRHELQPVIQVMARIEHPGAADAVINALKAHAEDTYLGYASYWYGRIIPDLPSSALPKFEALLPTLPEKMVDLLLEPVLALKNKPE